MSKNTDIRTPQADVPPAPDGLKAERIQEAAAGESRLKAERIQIALRDLPGWRLQRGARQIARTYELPNVQQVARMLQYVAELGYAGGSLPEVSLKGNALTFALPTIDGGGYLSEACFELAKSLEIRS